MGVKGVCQLSVLLMDSTTQLLMVQQVFYLSLFVDLVLLRDDIKIGCIRNYEPGEVYKVDCDHEKMEYPSTLPQERRRKNNDQKWIFLRIIPDFSCCLSNSLLDSPSTLLVLYFESRSCFCCF